MTYRNKFRIALGVLVLAILGELRGLGDIQKAGQIPEPSSTALRNAAALLFFSGMVGVAAALCSIYFKARKDTKTLEQVEVETLAQLAKDRAKKPNTGH